MASAATTILSGLNVAAASSRLTGLLREAFAQAHEVQLEGVKSQIVFG